jgi:tRNA1(Val) A37 N6-methylase TrmN6
MSLILFPDIILLQLKDGEKCTLLDLCSGFGYMGMFLSEMLPANKVVDPQS